jgi:hypothetical protein
MPKKKVLIHIGMGRCGSSSIQHSLRIKRTELHARGILYPETNPTEDAQHVLGSLADDKLEESEKAWREVIATFEKSGCHTLLVSTEYLKSISPGLFEFIKKLLSVYSVEVIFIARNQGEHLPSVYAQWTKAGIVFRSFKHFYEVTKKEWHLTRIIERWSEAYGVENMKCGLLRPGEDAVGIFAELSGVGEVGEMLKNTRIRINAGIHPGLLSLLALFDRFNSRNKIGSVFPGWNHIEPSRPDRNARLRGRLVALLEKLNKGRLGQGRRNLGRAMEEKMALEYEGTNMEFHSKYLRQEKRGGI